MQNNQYVIGRSDERRLMKHGLLKNEYIGNLERRKFRLKGIGRQTSVSGQNEMYLDNHIKMLSVTFIPKVDGIVTVKVTCK